MKSTRISRAHETLTIVAVPSSLSIFFSVGADVADELARELDRADLDHAAASSVSCDSWKLVETSLTTDSGGCGRALVRAADADHAARRLPRRRRDLVGDAVVDRRLVELVGAVGHAQRVEAELPVRRVGVAHAGRRGFLRAR